MAIEIVDLPLNMVIVHSYVSLQEGRYKIAIDYTVIDYIYNTY